jgi:two-component system NtrC family sensor kinase
LKHEPIKVDVISSETPFLIRSDPRLLEQVFVNITTNAIHAVVESGRKDGRVEITTEKGPLGAAITFKDNGVGIPKENREQVFRLFYTTKPPGKGTGLGLPICQNIVKNLGGEILLESTVGEGTAFTIHLPVS